VWVPKQDGDRRSPNDIPESERDYYLETRYPAFGNLVPRDVASRNAKYMTDQGKQAGVGLAVYLDFRDAIAQVGQKAIAQRYGNLFDMYQRITNENPYETPMRIYPAVHYTMGGLWVDYHLMSNIPGLFVLGEANFSDHGANRLGASALMQGLADGYFVIPATLGDYLARTAMATVTTDQDEFVSAEVDARARLQKLLSIQGNKTVATYHRELGQILWDQVGISRDRAGLEEAIAQIQVLRQDFWQNVRVPGESNTLNKNLELAGRVADFLELGELLARDALARDESCGCHFREEYQTADGEAKRNDAEFSRVFAWEYGSNDQPPTLHQEILTFESVELTQRSYK
ncbi:MAG: FAD-binding protein, partial [Leptolyngbyaceae cyanobacterium]